MFTKPEARITENLGSACAICGGEAEAILDLPGLPLTDTFTRDAVSDPITGIDQVLLFCAVCGHAQLEFQVSPNILYGGNYCFRTSASSTARKGTDFFFSVLDRAAPGRNFRCALDLGCNDLFLLERLKGRAGERVGVDPLWQGREAEGRTNGIHVIGQGIEDVDLSILSEKPDLVVCRHTLEHIAKPLEVVSRMLDVAADDAMFIFEVPGLDTLVERNRFDQVFHQHLHYFSQSSFTRMLKKVGAKPVYWDFNYPDWGAFAVAFHRDGSASEAAGEKPPPRKDDVLQSLEKFSAQINSTRKILENLNELTYGYGAAQMLPVLAYHLETDFGFLEAVLDDDPEKDGLTYWNLPVRVMPSDKAGNLENASVIITAVDSSGPIMKKLLSENPRQIINPLQLD